MEVSIYSQLSPRALQHDHADFPCRQAMQMQILELRRSAAEAQELATQTSSEADAEKVQASLRRALHDG